MYNTIIHFLYIAMIKIFWVGEDKDEDIDSYEDTSTIDYDRPKEDIWQIALDVVETPESIIIVAPVAGIELSDIDVVVQKNTLTVRGTRVKPQEIFWDYAVVKTSECFWGKFMRNIILPENLDFWSVKAMMENNLLVITLPKLRFGSQNVKIDRIDID